MLADEPIYRTGERSKVYVHVRLGDGEPLLPEMVQLTVRKPDGIETPVTLRPDPSASDPTNPFEQSFVGEFNVGARPGNVVVTAAVAIDGAAPRLVERTVPILAP